MISMPFISQNRLVARIYVLTARAPALRQNISNLWTCVADSCVPKIWIFVAHRIYRTSGSRLLIIAAHGSHIDLLHFGANQDLRSRVYIVCEWSVVSRGFSVRTCVWRWRVRYDRGVNCSNFIFVYICIRAFFSIHASIEWRAQANCVWFASCFEVMRAV